MAILQERYCKVQGVSGADGYDGGQGTTCYTQAFRLVEIGASIIIHRRSTGRGIDQDGSSTLLTVTNVYRQYGTYPVFKYV